MLLGGIIAQGKRKFRKNPGIVSAIDSDTREYYT
jgi:hypothetical protein